MRISDWSSDVCSSDLHVDDRDRTAIRRQAEDLAEEIRHRVGDEHPRKHEIIARVGAHFLDLALDPHEGRRRGRLVERSEEHASELQSLMRISYAVFCLKKKNKT